MDWVMLKEADLTTALKRQSLADWRNLSETKLKRIIAGWGGTISNPIIRVGADSVFVYFDLMGDVWDKKTDSQNAMADLKKTLGPKWHYDQDGKRIVQISRDFR